MAEKAEVWEGWFTVCVVIVAFGCLLWDIIQPDHVMIGAVAVLMAAGVVTVEEGLDGFANEGLLTVAVLFVVAAGISATGGLDWYMSKLLGHPTTIAGAQLRLMIPIAVVSAFLNNTPVVAVMIPIVQRWAENIHIPKEQVMIPLSFASILGGTCTLIGTSTNLVVLGMLKDWECQAHFPTAAAPLSRAVLHHHSPARSPLVNPHARQPMAAIRLGWIPCISRARSVAEWTRRARGERPLCASLRSSWRSAFTLTLSASPGPIRTPAHAGGLTEAPYIGARHSLARRLLRVR